jgi:hypothetical protein
LIDAGMCPRGSKETAMTPLRRRMLDALVLHGKAKRTQTTHRSPSQGWRGTGAADRLNNEQVQQYLLHLLQTRCLSRSTVN